MIFFHILISTIENLVSMINFNNFGAGKSLRPFDIFGGVQNTTNALAEEDLYGFPNGKVWDHRKNGGTLGMGAP